jgi:hypothetical protein
MTQAEVMATESNPPSEVRESHDETLVRYDSIQFADLDVRLVYVFVKDGLVRAKYLFSTEHSDLNDFVADYKTVEPLLNERYGKPTSEQAVWLSNRYQTESLNYLEADRSTPAQILPSDRFIGLSVSEGHLKLYTQWDGTRTRLLHALTGENGHIVHQVEYVWAQAAPFGGKDGAGTPNHPER